MLKKKIVRKFDNRLFYIYCHKLVLIITVLGDDGDK